MRRVLFIWLPHWPSERLLLQARRAGRAAPASPLALTELRQGGVRLAALDAAAAREGLYPGQALADARALVPGLVCVEHDPAGEAAALRRLARWCGRWSPDVAPLRECPQAQGVALDVSGVAHLFGGEAGLLADVLGKLHRLGLHACAALADALGAAWALALHHRDAAGSGVIAPSGAGLAPLLPLPVAALRLEPVLVERLCAVGLRRITDLVRLERASLARRFGPALIGRLDQAAGRVFEPLNPLSPPVRLAAARRFAEPLLTLEGVERVGAELCARLGGQLACRDLGVRRLVLRLFRVDGEVVQIAVGAGRPEQEPARLARLFKERLAALAERLDLGFGVDGAELVVIAAERLERRALSLDAAAAAEAEAQARDMALADRLAARLGEGAVRRLRPRASHIPERAQTSAGREAAPPGGFDADFGARRPLLLLEPPEPIEAVAELPDAPPRLFRWRRVAHQVARAEGPERIGAEWWAPDPGQADRPRDYYRIETREGRRFWLYREGLYGEGAQAPRWFLHGSFA